MVPPYFRFARKLLDSDLWLSEKFTRGQAWIDLVGLANHSVGHVRIRGIKIDVCRGQCAWSEEQLALRWKWSRGKVRRFLKELTICGKIEHKKSAVSSLICIINYNMYQGDDTTNDTTNGTENGTTNGHQTVQQTVPEQSMKKNEKNEKNTPKPPGVDSVDDKIPYAEILDYLNQKVGARFKNIETNKKLIRSRFKDGFTLDDFKSVIDHKTSVWLNDEKWGQYLRPATLFGTKFESYLVAAQRSDFGTPQSNSPSYLDPMVFPD